MNKAICWKDDEHFTKGKEYNCTDVYVKFETAMVDVVDNSGELIAVDINDKDFNFVFNKGELMMDEKKKNNKKKKNKIRKNLKYIFTLVGGIGGIIAFVELAFHAIEFYHNEQTLQPRFSLEKNVDENGTLMWKISNSGGAINNATIYPTIYVSFSFYDEERDEDIDVALEIPNYYIDYNYNNSDGVFYIKDDKQSELDDFIDKYTSLLCLDGIEYPLYSITSYYTLNYSDYKGERYNKIYTLTDNNLFEDNSERKIFGDTMSQLEEISKVPKPDIVVPLEPDTSCVISINYDNAVTQQVIHSEQDYNDYLYAAILDLINSKDKPIEEMYGDAILSNENLWIRDIYTGELIWVADDVVDFGFTE